VLDLKSIRAQDDEPLEDDELEPGRSETLLGRVVFVGCAGFDPGMLTIHSVRELLHSDVIVAPPNYKSVLADVDVFSIRPEAEFITLAEVDPDPAKAMDSVVERTVELAKAGKSVCWMLPGEPFVDGHVAPLAKRLTDAGCRVDFYSAVDWKSEIATLAGMNLDVPGAELPGRVVGDIRHLVDSTNIEKASLIFSSTRPELADTAKVLLGAGIPADADVRVVVGGGGFEQHSVCAELGNLASLELDNDGPLLVAVGPAGKLRPEFSWWENKPLIGWQILLPRTQGAPGMLEYRLHLHGAKYQVVPTMAIEPPRNIQAMERAVREMVDGEYQWVVFTDPHSVQAMLDELEGWGLDARSFAGLRVAASDPRAVELLQSFGIRPDLIASDGTSNGLASEFAVYDDLLDPLDGVLLPRASVATEQLAQSLTDLGWRVEEVMFARAVRSSPPPAEIRQTIKTGGYDAVVFTSATAVRNLVGIAGKPHPDTIVAAIGPRTAQACAEHDLRVDVVAPSPGEVELVDALALFAEQRAANLIAEGGHFYRPSQRPRRRRNVAK